RVGTTSRRTWQNNGAQTNSTSTRSIRVRAGAIAAQSAEVEVYFGALFTAPAGWAKGAIMWMADDVPKSFNDLAIPIIESYGWKCNRAIATTYSTDNSENYIPINDVKKDHERGHEIWNHLRRHEDMDATTTAQKTRALKASADYWKSIGI